MPATPARPPQRRRLLAAPTLALVLAGFVATACEPLPPPLCEGEEQTIVGTAGPDTLDGTAGPDVIAGLGGNDLIRSLAGDDIICGDAGNDTVEAGSGRDLVDGRGGDENLIGGAGRDVVLYSAAAQPVTVDLAPRRATGVGRDTVTGFEDVVGSRHGDRLTGDTGANVIEGADGTDTCIGGGGADTLRSCP